MRISYAVAAVALLFAACGPAPAKTHVKSEYNASADYSSYKTWAWATKTSTEAPSNIDKLIQSATASQLAAKGMTEASSRAAAGLVVDYTIDQVRKTEVQDDGWGWGQDFGGPDPQPYDHGTLVITMADPKTKTKIWQGTAEMVVENKEFSVDDVDSAVAKLLAQYPPDIK